MSILEHRTVLAKLAGKRLERPFTSANLSRMSKLQHQYECGVSRDEFIRLLVTSTTVMEKDVMDKEMRAQEAEQKYEHCKAACKTLETRILQLTQDIVQTRDELQHKQDKVKKDDIRVQALAAVTLTPATTPLLTSQFELKDLETNITQLRTTVDETTAEAIRTEKEYESINTLLHQAKTQLHLENETQAPKREQLSMEHKHLHAKKQLMSKLAGFCVDKVDESGLVTIKVGQRGVMIEIQFDMTTNPIMLLRCGTESVGALHEFMCANATWERTLATNAITAQHAGMYVQGIARAIRCETALLDDIKTLCEEGNTQTHKRHEFLVMFNAKTRIVSALFLMGSVEAKLRVPTNYGLFPLEIVSVEETCATKIHTSTARIVTSTMMGKGNTASSCMVGEWIKEIHKELTKKVVVG